MALAGGRLSFTGEDIGEPAEAALFMIELGAAPDDQCAVDAPGRRWQTRVEDLALIGEPADALARAA